ncbi:GntR family transcriptional regulator [Stella humosa]|uniref:GntR family transcriptional regulator n=1 Tax=Stella humosa TaxID=94 RepID=A0A3N1LJY3_9PROT|nr:PLP-dependent aminotransferase family protein [Stella humosa]ROP91314.1 GntR family transcriptional regulator [Stella humosa]BBK34330.1 GntR family transcriptional regulator [Stella humosa]
MTIWLPHVADRPGPKYRAIADALADDIRCGAVRPGTRLPTHRELAWRLGLTVGTVTRAYAEAERRGLIAGEVGRGTYVRGAAPADVAISYSAADIAAQPALIDLSLNFPVIPGHEAELASALRRLADRGDLAALLPYHPHGGRAPDRAAGAAWIARSGLTVRPDEVAVTAGGQHAILVCLAAVAASGDTVLVENLTYPGVKAAAALLGLKLVGVAIDEQGVVPDQLAAAARATGAKALYCMPTLHNPTAAVMPEARRRAIAAVAVRHEMAIIEDDCYGFLVPDAPPPITAMGIAEGLFLTSLSKSIAAGQRIGYVTARPGRLERVTQAIRATSWMASPLAATIATEWIADGTAQRMVRERRAEAAARQAMVEAAMPDARAPGAAVSYHAWLRLPDAWRADEFVSEARRRGVAVTPPTAFAVTRQSAPDAVRICYGAAAGREELARGLSILTSLLGEQPGLAASVV